MCKPLLRLRAPGRLGRSIWLTTVALLIGLLSPPSTALELGDLGDYRVTRPGEVLFVRRARAAALAELSVNRLEKWCGPARQRWRSHKAITRIRTPKPDDEQTDVRSQPFAWTVMNAAARAFGSDDAEARRALITNLRRWARGKALTKLQDRRENTYYSLERTLLPTIVAYSLIRDHPDLKKEERKLIGRWLNRLVRLRGIKRPEAARGDVSLANNHRYLSDSVDMAWGALRDDDELFRRGIESYLLALGQMRADGSLPLETARGAKALWYQRHAIASLVTIAEMAAVQGYDLYGLEVEDRRLHDAIGFLARAIDQPRLVWPYAQENLRPGMFQNYKVQDSTFLGRRGHGRHYMAWLEIWRTRFPEGLETRQLLHQIQERGPDPRPMIDEYSGGNMTCFFALPE